MPDHISLDDWKDMDNLSVEIPKQAVFYRVTQELSDFIDSLPISREANNRLVELMTRQTIDAEHSGFLSGFEMGLKMQKQLDAEHNDTLST